MKRYLSVVLVAILMLSFVIPVYAQETKRTTVFLVRHAEKESDGTRDPSLTEAGQQRALDLAYLLADVELDAVYCSQYKRTNQTAKPTADAKGIELSVITSLRLNDLRKTLDDLLIEHQGGKILIASHSDITPALIKLIRQETFTMDDVTYINDSVYDDIFVVTFTHRESVDVIHLKYGKQTKAK